MVAAVFANLLARGAESSTDYGVSRVGIASYPTRRNWSHLHPTGSPRQRQAAARRLHPVHRLVRVALVVVIGFAAFASF